MELLSIVIFIPVLPLELLLPNADKDLSGLRDLTISGAHIASTSIASPSINSDAYSSAGS